MIRYGAVRCGGVWYDTGRVVVTFFLRMLWRLYTLGVTIVTGSCSGHHYT